MKKKVLVTKHGVIVDLVKAVDWHCGFSFRNLRIGASFEQAMWQFDFLFFYVWCDRYEKHGKTLSELPENAEIIIDPRSIIIKISK